MRKRAPVQDYTEYSASGGFDFFLNFARGLPRSETWLDDQDNAVGQGAQIASNRVGDRCRSIHQHIIEDPPGVRAIWKRGAQKPTPARSSIPMMLHPRS